LERTTDRVRVRPILDANHPQWIAQYARGATRAGAITSRPSRSRPSHITGTPGTTVRSRQVNILADLVRSSRQHGQAAARSAAGLGQLADLSLRLLQWLSAARCRFQGKVSGDNHPLQQGKLRDHGRLWPVHELSLRILPCGFDGVVLVAVDIMPTDVDVVHLGVRDFDASGIGFFGRFRVAPWDRRRWLWRWSAARWLDG